MSGGSDLERLRREINQRASAARTLLGETGPRCFVPGLDGSNVDEWKKSSEQWKPDLKLEDWASAELKSVAADFCHAVNKYEPTRKASVVGKLAEILRTPFESDLLDAITTCQRMVKVTVYEAQSRETVCDSLKIGCLIAGMGQSSMREHLLLSATVRQLVKFCSRS